MAALTERRKTPRRSGELLSAPVKAGAMIHEGALVALENGYATPAREATGLVAVGVARASVDNTAGGDGAARVELARGVFAFVNAGDVTRAHIGQSAFMVDDQTVSASEANGARSPAGTIFDVDEHGVWVDIR